MRKQPMIVIVGPTASGKTRLSVDVAKNHNGQVVSADSMQIYKGMAIATAKPTEQEMQGIKHYLVDCVQPSSSFSVADYVTLARDAVSQIAAEGKLPVVVGGTGLYIQALVDNVRFDDTCSDTELREQLYKTAAEQGNLYLWEKLREADPKTAAKLHPNNLSRVVRALEVYHKTGVPISEHQYNSRLEESPYEPLMIGLNFSDRNELYRRIDRRVDSMISDGLVEEARQFYESGGAATAAQAIGYKELIPFFKGEAPLEECVLRIKTETRHYAKRQLTWFRRDARINWFYLDEFVSYQIFYEKIEKLIAKTEFL